MRSRRQADPGSVWYVRLRTFQNTDEPGDSAISNVIENMSLECWRCDPSGLAVEGRSLLLDPMLCSSFLQVCILKGSR